MKKVKPLRRRVDEVLKVLSKDGFRLASGSDAGWLGDGMYVLTNDRETLRITRSRGEEFLDVAFVSNAREQDWFGITELLVAVDDLAFDDAVKGVVPHDLDFKVAAYIGIRPKIEAQLGPNGGLHQKLMQVRQRDRALVQEKYGRKK